MQIVAPLVGHDDQRHFRDELQEQVSTVFTYSEHLHHVQVVKVHLVLDVQPQNLSQVLVLARVQNRQVQLGAMEQHVLIQGVVACFS